MPTADPNRTTDAASAAPPYQLDARGRRRSPTATTGHRLRKPPATKGRRFPPDPLPVEDFQALFAACVPLRPGRVGELSALRLKALIVVLWRTGVRISEALALEERDLNERDQMIVVRCGKGGKRRLVMMDAWGWKQCQSWFAARAELEPGQVFCVLSGPTEGRAMQTSDVRRQFGMLRKRSGVRRRVAAHQMRHSAAVDWRKEDLDLLTIQQQLGHANLGVTQLYLRSIAVEEVLAPDRTAPTTDGRADLAPERPPPGGPAPSLPSPAVLAPPNGRPASRCVDSP